MSADRLHAEATRVAGGARVPLLVLVADGTAGSELQARAPDFCLILCRPYSGERLRRAAVALAAPTLTRPTGATLPDGIREDFPFACPPFLAGNPDARAVLLQFADYAESEAESFGRLLGSRRPECLEVVHRLRSAVLAFGDPDCSERLRNLERALADRAIGPAGLSAAGVVAAESVRELARRVRITAGRYGRS
jgi:hypothetical protein